MNKAFAGRIQQGTSRAPVRADEADGEHIDAHHHIWRLDAVPWLRGPGVPRIFGSYAKLRRDYLIHDYLADAVPVTPRGSVYIQVKAMGVLDQIVPARPATVLVDDIYNRNGGHEVPR